MKKISIISAIIDSNISLDFSVPSNPQIINYFSLEQSAEQNISIVSEKI